jgi:hypothetical protein
MNGRWILEGESEGRRERYEKRAIYKAGRKGKGQVCTRQG